METSTTLLDTSAPTMPDEAERKALFTCAFLAGSLLMAPGERVAAGACGVIGLAIFLWHTRLARRARTATAAKAPANEPPRPPAAA